MNTDPNIVAELRNLFLDGATPSRLMQHILQRHPVESKAEKYRLIQDYFAAAFRVPHVRNLRRENSYSGENLQYAFLNEGLLHDILARQSQWNQGRQADHLRQPSWLDTLTATSDEELLKNAQAAPPEELAASWYHLSENERAYICRLRANLNHVYERSRILARLAERLQYKLSRFEEALGGNE